MGLSNSGKQNGSAELVLSHSKVLSVPETSNPLRPRTAGWLSPAPSPLSALVIPQKNPNSSLGSVCRRPLNGASRTQELPVTQIHG